MRSRSDLFRNQMDNSSHKLTHVSDGNSNPEGSLREEHHSSIARNDGRFSKRFLVAEGNLSQDPMLRGSFRGPHRGSFRGTPSTRGVRLPPENQASPGIRNGEFSTSGYDPFNQTGSTDSMSDISNSWKGIKINVRSNESWISPGLHASPHGFFHKLGERKHSGENGVISSKKHSHERSNGSNIWNGMPLA